MLKRLMVPELMAYLPDAAKFALMVAVGCSVIIKPILSFLEDISPRSPVLDAAVAVVMVTLPVTFIMGVILLFMYLHVTPPAAAPPPGATRRFAALACTLASALLVALSLPLAAFLFLAGSHSPHTGFTPT